jgi:hypothetical protein
VTAHDEPSAADDPDDVSDPVSTAALDAALERVPQGALALAALSVGTLLVAWLLVYFLVFLPRGAIG